MPELLRSPGIALIWEICARKRTSIWALVGITVFAGVFNSLVPDGVSAQEAGRPGFDAFDAIMLVNFHLMIAALLLVLAICGYAEFNPQKSSTGFPHRLFTLPVTSLQLVAAPMFVGVAVVELVCLVWVQFVLPQEEPAGWIAVLIGVYMVFYLTILWTLPVLGSLRMLVMGLVGVAFIIAAGLPTFPQETLPWWLKEGFLRNLLAGSAVVAFLTSWTYVARQRSGGRSHLGWLKALADRLSCSLPRRTKPFATVAAAQLWFEWRRSGFMLPVLVAALLVVVIAPFSWWMRNDAGSTLRILAATLAMPVMLALPVGKAFSKPDFWSTDLSLPAFIAVRPLASSEIVASKMKAAALSSTISWLLVLAFLSAWLPLWANLDSLAIIRVVLWQIHGRTVYPQYGIAALCIVAGMVLTWRFLVGSLWLGLFGNRKVFALTALPYAFAPIFGAAAISLLFRKNQTILSWMHDNLGRLLPSIVWLLALAVIARLWISAFSWRPISSNRIRQYLLFWLLGTACLVTLAILLSPVLRFFLPSDAYRFRNMLILFALLAIPFSRLGIASSSLERNRHR